MELWIRSQSKEMLVKVESITLIEGVKSDWYLGDGGCILGIYKSKERAMQVLDEIQQHIEKQGENYLLSDENGIITGQKYYGYIYQMPID